MSHPNDPSKMVQTVFQPTRKKSAGVGSFWWKHIGGLLYDFLVICGCAIFIAVFCRVGSVWVGSFLFQWKHGLSVFLKVLSGLVSLLARILIVISESRYIVCLV